MHRAVEAYFSELKEPLFAVLDAARDPLIYASLMECEEPLQSLYEGPKGEELALVVPYLVSLSPQSSFLRTLVRQGWGKSWGIYLTCDRSMDEVRKHLRRLLLVKTESGKQILFRYYDPRVLRVFLPTCTREELENFFGPIASFTFEGDDDQVLVRAGLNSRKLSSSQIDLSE